MQTLSPRQARVTGCILAACGLFLVIMMSGLIVLFTRLLLGYTTMLGKMEFTGGPVFGGLILILFAAILAFGVAALYSGVWQIRHQRRHPQMLVIAEYAFTGLAVMGTLVSIFSVFTED